MCIRDSLGPAEVVALRNLLKRAILASDPGLPKLPSAHPRLLHPARRPGALALLLAAIGLGLVLSLIHI